MFRMLVVEQIVIMKPGKVMRVEMTSLIPARNQVLYQFKFQIQVTFFLIVKASVVKKSFTIRNFYNY